MGGGAIREILSHLFRHRVRSLLTITGLVVGIFALALVGSLGETLHMALRLEEESNSGTLSVRPVRWDRQLSPSVRRAVRRVPGVASTLTVLWGRLAEPEEGQSGSPPAPEWARAVDSDIPGLEYGPPLVPGSLLRGRRPDPGATNEVLLAFELAQAHGWQVGDSITIRGRPFLVVGILERPPLGNDRNAYLDYATLRAMLRIPTDFLLTLDVIPESGQDSADLASRIGALVPDLAIETPEQKMQQNRQSFGLLGAIAGVSVGLALLAGVLAIVNTMLMSVGERQGEIGLKKALGASDGDILLEIVLEAGTVGMLGGGLAVLLAWFATLGVNEYSIARLGMKLLRLTPRLASGAVALSALLGALAGAYPACRAARKDPVQALRNAPSVAYAGGGWRRLRYLVGRRARWLLTVGGISGGILILTVALSLAEFLNRFTESAMEATHDRIGLYVRRDAHMALSTTVRELQRTSGVRGVVVMAYDGRLFEGDEGWLGLLSQQPQLYGLDSPTGELGFGVPTRAAVASGRFLLPDSLREVVLGPRLAEGLGLEVGDVLTIRDRDFTVVGIWAASPQDSLTGHSVNAYVTMAALQSLSGVDQPTPQLTALVAAGTDPEELAARLQEAMPEWTVLTSQASAEEMRQVMAIFTLILVGYVSLGLLAGGLSVVNTMFMAVTARTSEIGLKKAVGASDGDILAEVVEESGWVGLLGGALGLAAGWLVTLAVNTFTWQANEIRLLLVTPRLVVAALVFTTFLGMIAGLYPAWRASRLDPVQALRGR